MAAIPFKAMIVRENEDGTFSRELGEKTTDDLPAGNVLIRVDYSSLNFKDALSASGNKGVTRSYPHTPGIDAAGTVEESSGCDFKPGDRVLVTGYDLGMNTPGGFGQFIRVPAGWVVPLPETLSLKESMVYGTAGFTAAICVLKIQDQGITPEHGEALVTGATGGVGSMAVSFLAKNGYTVTAVSGKKDSSGFLKNLGAASIIDRSEVLDDSDRPLLRGRWAAVVDTVGGDMLSSVLKQAQLNSAVACCGNVAGFRLNTTVYPFILRGVSLMGADSANATMELRQRAWKKMSGPWRPEHLMKLFTEVSLEEIDPYIDRILQGQITGRTVVRLKEKN